MPSTTRRAILFAATSGLAALAGCASGSDSHSRPVPEPRGEPVEYTAVRVRDADGRALFTPAERTETPTDPRRSRNAAEVLTSAADLETYAFAATDPATRLADFVRATDFAARSVFLYQSAIGECNQLRLRRVAVEDGDHPRLSFCQSLRAADVDCSAGEHDTVGFAVRMDIAGESLSGFGTSMERCERPQRPPAFTANVTVGDGEQR